ncbi:MAG: hypothetical protein NZL89_06745 [Leptospiraceae bacterium]|nr:hypothetical protein [Leptospiraceae bacterium]
MGLRERASEFAKKKQAEEGIDLGLELRPEPARSQQQTPAPDSQPAGTTTTPATAVATNFTPEIAPSKTGTPTPSAPGEQKNLLDAILNLIEIYKEFGSVRSAQELWPLIAYSLLAQLGTKYIAIFMEDDGRMQLVHATGYALPQDYSFSATGRLCRMLREVRRPLWLEDAIAEMPENEGRIFSAHNIRYAVPVFRYEELRGVIAINPPEGKSRFPEDDLLYLKICGEMLGAMEGQLRLLADAERKKQQLEKLELAQQYLTEFCSELGKLPANAPRGETWDRHLKKHFPRTCLLILLRQDFFLRTVFSAGFPAENVNNLELALSEPILEKLRAGQREFAPKDWELSESLGFLSQFRTVHAFLVEHRGEIAALAFCQTQNREFLPVLGAMVQNYVLHQLAESPGIAPTENPVAAIRSVLEQCELELRQKAQPYAVVVTDIANYQRLHNLYGDSHATAVRDFSRKAWQQILDKNDFTVEIYPGHFVSILRQKETGDAWRLSRMLQKQAGKQFADEELRPIFQHKIYARPHLAAIPFELLFKSG